MTSVLVSSMYGLILQNMVEYIRNVYKLKSVKSDFLHWPKNAGEEGGEPPTVIVFVLKLTRYKTFELIDSKKNHEFCKKKILDAKIKVIDFFSIA